MGRGGRVGERRKGGRALAAAGLGRVTRPHAASGAPRRRRPPAHLLGVVEEAFRAPGSARALLQYLTLAHRLVFYLHLMFVTSLYLLLLMVTMWIR